MKPIDRHPPHTGPSPEDPFLILDRGPERPAETICYGELWRLAERWRNHLDIRTRPDHGNHSPSPLLLRPDGRPEDLLAMACLRVLRVPFVVMDPQASPREADRLRELFADIESAPVDLLSNFVSEGPGRRASPPSAHSGTPAASQSRDGQTPPSPAAWFFTSGTEGAPKCVPVSDRQIRVSAAVTESLFRPDKGNAWLLTLPMHHVGGASILLRSLEWGSGVMLPADRSWETVRRILEGDQRVQTVSMVARQLGRWLKEPAFAWPQSLRAVLLGGGPVPAWIAEQCRERNLPAYSGFGMTETFGMLLCQDLRTARDSTAVGIPPSSLQVRVDPDGELHIRTPQLFDGEEWFRTGDMARLDEDGTLHILARRTDLILSGGENISPVVVEAAFSDCDWIEAVGVTGVDDPSWGQRVVALIERRAAAIDPKPTFETDPESRERIWARLKKHERPKTIHYVDRLPRTALGKLSRGELRKLAERLQQ